MPIISPSRDSAVDLARALCILGVVVLHSLMVGVTLSPAGPVFANAGESGGWLVPVSWVLQVMPLFFVIGGFSGLTALRALRRRGGSAAGFAAARVRRLLVPAIAAVGAAGALLALLADAGVAADLIELAGFRFGQPLWFLGVFLLCQGLLPVTARLHDTAPVRSIAMLAAISLAVDTARSISGIDGIGFLNLLFVWLTLQQLGFLLADGRIDALSTRVRTVVAAGAVAALLVSFMSGFHSPDLIANTNPPTTALLLVGVVHTALFSVLRPRLRAIASTHAISAFTRFVSTRAMTIYLWHMPVLLTLAGVTALVGMGAAVPLPEPASLEWWLTRPLWLLCTLTATALLSFRLARLEISSPPRGTGPGLGAVTAGRAAAGVIVGASAVVLLLVAGTSPATAAIAVGCWLLALRLATRPIGASRPGPVLVGADGRGR